MCDFSPIQAHPPTSSQGRDSEGQQVWILKVAGLSANTDLRVRIPFGTHEKEDLAICMLIFGFKKQIQECEINPHKFIENARFLLICKSEEKQECFCRENCNEN